MKREIISQLQVELLSIAILAIILSFPLTRTLSKSIEKEVFSANEGNNTTLNVKLSDWLITSLMTIGLAEITIVVSSNSVLKTKPKEILSNIE